ncbi:MAG: hypothetical protein R2834_18720 [Rhodothermales bacterium]
MQQHTFVDSIKDGLTSLEGLDRDYLESSRRRLFLMPEQQRQRMAAEYRSKAALYFELYRTASTLEEPVLR